MARLGRSQPFPPKLARGIVSPPSGTTLTPSLFTNTQTFYSPKILETLKPALFTNTQTFYAPTIKETLKPALFTNSQTFYSPTLKLTLKPGIFSNSQSFYSPSVSVAGSSKQPSLLTNSQAFYSPTIKITHKPALFANAQSFYAPTLKFKLYPSLFTNSQTFYAPRVLGGASDNPVGYWELKVAIKAALDSGLAALSPAPTVAVEEAMPTVPRESWVGIYQDDRRAPADVQSLYRGRETRIQVRHTIWVWRFGMKPATAVQLRDSLIGDVEYALMLDPTFGGQCEGSWLNGGRFLSADGPNNGFYAGGEIELICETLAQVNSG